MRASPLMLKEYFTTDLSFSAQPGFELTSPEAVTILPDDIKVEVEELAREENSLVRSYHITVELEATNTTRFPWAFSISLVGFFEVTPNWASDHVDKLFSANAPALLYSAAREALAMISGRGPYRRVLLPSITFVQQLPSEKVKADEEQLSSQEVEQLPAKSVSSQKIPSKSNTIRKPARKVVKEQ